MLLHTLCYNPCSLVIWFFEIGVEAKEGYAIINFGNVDRWRDERDESEQNFVWNLDTIDCGMIRTYTYVHTNKTVGSCGKIGKRTIVCTCGISARRPTKTKK